MTAQKATKITIRDERSVARLIPQAQRTTVQDSKVSGLELRIAAGDDPVTSWSLRFRVKGRQRRMRIGQWPRTSVKAARVRANQLLRQVDTGTDPVEAQKAARDAAERAQLDTVKAVAARYVIVAKRTKRTGQRDESMLAAEVLPYWGKRPLASIERRDVKTLIERIIARDQHTSARRVLALISRLFMWAMEDGLIGSTPTMGLGRAIGKTLRESETVAAYRDPDTVRFWKQTEALDVPDRVMLRLTLLTACRAGEAADLTWDELSPDLTWWTLPASRAKNKQEHRIPICELARAELRAVPRVDGDPFVFTGYRVRRSMKDANEIAFADLPYRPKPRHSLRATASTGMAAAGVPIEHISHVMNHVVGSKVTRGYEQHSHDGDKLAALRRWEARLRDLLDPTAAESRLLTFPSA
jgi:integrase